MISAFINIELSITHPGLHHRQLIQWLSDFATYRIKVAEERLVAANRTVVVRELLVLGYKLQMIVKD